MRRRDFIAFSALSLLPGLSRAQAAAPRFADMHAHLGFRYQLGYRAQMEKGGLLLAAEKVTSEAKLAVIGGRLQLTREMQPGELRANFEGSFGRRRQALAKEGLVEVSSVQALDRVLAQRTPGLVLAAEGADFLEGDLAYLDKVRARGLVHLQLVHYYPRSQLGAAHVGIGSDMHGLVRTAMQDYADFASLEEMLGKRGLKPAEVEGIMGANYIRVLRGAMNI